MKIEIDKSKVKIEPSKFIIDFDQELINQIMNARYSKISTLVPGEEFTLGDEKFIILEHTEIGTKVISKEFAYTDMIFGDSSDWKKSNIREKLNGEYYSKIAGIVGPQNIIPMERDLISLDGLDDYGVCEDKISLLTATEYARYHKILGLNSNYKCWQWTITPESTPSNGYTRGVCCVRSGGALDWIDCVCGSGVRPFCILNSSTVVGI